MEAGAGPAPVASGETDATRSASQQGMVLLQPTPPQAALLPLLQRSPCAWSGPDSPGACPAPCAPEEQDTYSASFRAQQPIGAAAIAHGQPRRQPSMQYHGNHSSEGTALHAMAVAGSTALWGDHEQLAQSACTLTTAALSKSGAPTSPPQHRLTPTPPTDPPSPLMSGHGIQQPRYKGQRDARRRRPSNALVLVKQRWLQDLLQHLPPDAGLEVVGFGSAASSPDHSTARSHAQGSDGGRRGVRTRGRVSVGGEDRDEGPGWSGRGAAAGDGGEDVIVRRRDLELILALLPPLVAQRYRLMQDVLDTTAGFCALAEAAVDPDGFYVEQQVGSMLQRFQQQQQGLFRLCEDTDYIKEAEARRHLINSVIGAQDVNAAATVIQRAYRAYKRRRSNWKVASIQRTHMMDRDWNIAKSRFRSMAVRQDSQYSISPISPISHYPSQDLDLQWLELQQLLPSPSELHMSRKDSRPMVQLRLMTAYSSASDVHAPHGYGSFAPAGASERGETDFALGGRLLPQCSAPVLSYGFGSSNSSSGGGAALTPTGPSHPPRRSLVPNRAGHAPSAASHVPLRQPHPPIGLGAAEPGVIYRSAPAASAGPLAPRASALPAPQKGSGSGGGAIVRLGTQGFVPVSAGCASGRSWAVDSSAPPSLRTSHSGTASSSSAACTILPSSTCSRPSAADAVPLVAMDRASGRGAALQYLWRHGGAAAMGTPLAPSATVLSAGAQLHAQSSSVSLPQPPPQVRRDPPSPATAAAMAGAGRARELPAAARPLRRASESGANLGLPERGRPSLPPRTSSNGVACGRAHGRLSLGGCTPIAPIGEEEGMSLPRVAWFQGGETPQGARLLPLAGGYRRR